MRATAQMQGLEVPAATIPLNGMLNVEHVEMKIPLRGVATLAAGTTRGLVGGTDWSNEITVG